MSTNTQDENLPRYCMSLTDVQLVLQRFKYTYSSGNGLKETIIQDLKSVHLLFSLFWPSCLFMPLNASDNILMSVIYGIKRKCLCSSYHISKLCLDMGLIPVMYVKETFRLIALLKRILNLKIISALVPDLTQVKLCTYNNHITRDVVVRWCVELSIKTILEV